MAGSTSWLNMSSGWRKELEHIAARGPAQREAQYQKRERERRTVAMVESFMSRGMSEAEARALAKTRLAFKVSKA